jgi:tetratricopeptide (TPR) repeat protein
MGSPAFFVEQMEKGTDGKMNQWINGTMIQFPKRRSDWIGTVLWLWFCLAMLGGGRAVAEPRPVQINDLQARQYAARGLDLIMDGDLDRATEIFQQIEREDPQSPLGYLLEADAVWWRIYYTTANLIDPDVFAVTDSQITPYDAHFQDLINTTILRAEASRRAGQGMPRSYLYEGMAYALKARLAGLRDKDLPTARAGKKMRFYLLKALQLDPNLTDAYLGIGIYNYFVDTLSAIVKLLAWIIRLPGGSRAEGLRQLELVTRQGELGKDDARFYLAKDYSRPEERQYVKSLQLFEEIAQEFPHNPLWPMLIGSLHFRIGERTKGEQIYWEVLKKTAGEKTDVEKAVHQAAHEALQRLHPGQAIE